MIRPACCYRRFIPTCVGNTATGKTRAIVVDGSSPRAWGTRDPPTTGSTLYSVHPHVRGEHFGVRGHAVTGLRFIPTCVGNTTGSCAIRYTFSGSSPRAWGTHPHILGNGREPRFIPTCVGNTAGFMPAARAAFGSSPRAWGTRRRGPPQRTSSTGSSPRAWGTRITRAAALSPSPVHPHVRGEHLAGRAGVAVVQRFIPTCVGNTSQVRFKEVLKYGSSPRAWGTHIVRRICTARNPVHPHVRGEHAALLAERSGLIRFIPDLPPSMCPHPELGYGCGERFGDRFRCRWAIAQ